MKGELYGWTLRLTDEFLISVHEGLQCFLLPLRKVHQIKNGGVLGTTVGKLTTEHTPQAFEIFDRIGRNE